MLGVIDTSALIRLYVPDGPLPDSFDEFLRGVERGGNRAIAPELLVAEAGNVINKNESQGNWMARKATSFSQICLQCRSVFFLIDPSFRERSKWHGNII